MQSKKIYEILGFESRNKIWNDDNNVKKYKNVLNLLQFEYFEKKLTKIFVRSSNNIIKFLKSHKIHSF